MSEGGKRRVLNWLFFGCIAGALGVFAWQGLTWLMTSVWKPVSVVHALIWLHIPWAVFPGKWLELHQFLGNTPLAPTLLGLALLSFLALAVFD